MRASRPRLDGIHPANAKRLKAFGVGYTRFVRIAKFALPVVALVIIGVVISNLSEAPLQQQIAALPKEEMTKPGQAELIEAKYEGTDEKGQTYTLTADKATRQSEKENVILLTKPKADISLQSGGWMAVHAETGRFDNTAAKLDLEGNVIVFHDAGYEIKMQRAHVDLTAKKAISDMPIEGHGPLGDITAQNMAITDDGMKIFFGGPATLVLRLHAKKEPG